MISFTVPGTPIPQGSKTAGVTKAGKPYLRDANAKKLKPWRKAVSTMASTGERFGSVPVAVRVYFYFERPKRSKFTPHAVRPDVDKLARSILDGLTDAGVIEDDARVVELIASKHYSDKPRAVIKVWPYSGEDCA